MQTSEHDRHELFRALERVIGAEPARTLMEQLPPRPWDQLATRHDLSNGLQLLEHRLVAEFRAQIIAQNRLLFFSMIGAILTAASLAFAAVRFQSIARARSRRSTSLRTSAPRTMPSRHRIGPWSAADQPENLLAATLHRSNIRRCGLWRCTPFWGRERELGRPHDELDAVIQSGQGRMPALRGRRQSGQQWLLAEFVERAAVPYLVTTAVKDAPSDVQLQTVITALSPAEVAAAVGDCDPVDVIDTQLATGGYPRLVSAAAEHPAATFVHTQLRDDTSPLIVTVEWILSSKFREAESVRAVLEAIGSVEVEHATFGSAVEFLRGDEKTARAAVARAVVLGVHEAQLLAVCPAGADVDARFNGVVVAADIVDAFAG